MANTKYFNLFEFNKKERLGERGDGGYVIALLDDTIYDCYISCGINNEESFSRDFINKYNTNKEDNYAFDGTIIDYPYHYTDKITFIKKNIGGHNDDFITNLSFLIEKYNNIFLKMDIEGGEYPWLNNITEAELSNFKQIVIELHGVNDDSYGENYKNKMNCLNKLNNTHYLVHLHGNNHAGITNNIPDVLEATYIHKSYFKTVPLLDNKDYPLQDLDFKNYVYLPELPMNCLNKIPKIFLQSSKEKQPEYVLKILNSKMPSGWTYQHFTDNEIIAFFENNKLEEFPDPITRFNSIKTGACKTCFFRLYYLYIYGGIFLDSDAIFTINIEDITKNNSFFISFSSYVPGVAFNGLMGSVPNNLIIYKALKYAYETDISIINNDYFYSCRNLYNIINEGNFNFKYDIYQEAVYDDTTSCHHCNGELIALHYHVTKIIPNLSENDLNNMKDHFNNKMFNIFDWQRYTNYYPDLQRINNKDDALHHWVNFGKNEGRQPFYM